MICFSGISKTIKMINLLCERSVVFDAYIFVQT